ncbi:MAG: hypothetical protein A4S09_00955 [Proteobacteria bacterium SG_bin7]|nr:MAG: hypothetical protein A4S09_00955 [Proteobacteria bacterium SG_bin7]
MLSFFGPTQKRLLHLLVNSSEGMTLDEIAEELEISRNAVDQHITKLERNRYLKVLGVKETGGRPSRCYTLSPEGKDLFPKQYSWFSEVLLGAIKGEQGARGLAEFLRTVGKSVASQIFLKGKSVEEKIPEVVNVMQSLGYEAQSPEKNVVEARNCVYHHLAERHPEVCEFDQALLESLLEARVNHEECMFKGGRKCRFSFTPRTQTKWRS